MIVNGKEYPLWSQFVERQAEFVGRTLEDHDPDCGVATTKVTGVTLEPNGKDSAFFSIEGEDFRCGFDVTVGGVAAGEEGWITFQGYGGHRFRMSNA